MQTTGVTPPDTISDLALFLKSLAEEGHAVVTPHPLHDDAGEATAVLEQLDTHARNELALDTPGFSAPTALWAARLLYHLGQFTVCRDIGEERIMSVCGLAGPERRGPETDWSADLTLRHLPKLFQLARHLSNADPLVRQMRQIAAAWPLSSVGIAGLDNLQIDSFIGHPALRRLYADRILSEGDVSRLGDPRVDDVLRGDIGVHRQLVPAIAARLFPTA
jgi:hypothetical protein